MIALFSHRYQNLDNHCTTISLTQQAVRFCR